MNKLIEFVNYHWPESRLGLDYDVTIDKEGVQRLSVWSESFGSPPDAEEVEAWKPGERSPRRVGSDVAWEELSARVASTNSVAGLKGIIQELIGVLRHLASSRPAT